MDAILFSLVLFGDYGWATLSSLTCTIVESLLFFPVHKDCAALFVTISKQGCLWNKLTFEEPSERDEVGVNFANSLCY